MRRVLTAGGAAFGVPLVLAGLLFMVSDGPNARNGLLTALGIAGLAIVFAAQWNPERSNETPSTAAIWAAIAGLALSSLPFAIGFDQDLWHVAVLIWMTVAILTVLVAVVLFVRTIWRSA